MIGQSKTNQKLAIVTKLYIKKKKKKNLIEYLH